nr:hypothetical protein [Streptomyces sp. QL37]
MPVTVGLREAGSLGLAGPRARLSGLARSTVAQLAALHSPFDLEIVLISTDRADLPAVRRSRSAVATSPLSMATAPHSRKAIEARHAVRWLAGDRPGAWRRGRSAPAGRAPTGPPWPRRRGSTPGRTPW